MGEARYFIILVCYSSKESEEEQTSPFNVVLLQEIKRLGVKAGVAINPHSPIELLSEILEEIDLVCLMSVNPGFGGQKFIEHTYSKVANLKKLLLQTGSNALIEVDGGVSDQNARRLVEAGADILVAGSFVFGASDPLATIASLKSISV